MPAGHRAVRSRRRDSYAACGAARSGLDGPEILAGADASRRLVAHDPHSPMSKPNVRTLLAFLALAVASLLPACNDNDNGGGGTFDPAAFVGTWSGTWTNTTFSSTGAVSVVITQAGSDLGFSVDLDGNVFGGANPAAENFTASFDTSRATLASTTSAVYGDVTATLNANGSITINGTNINGQVASFTLTGDFDATQMTCNVAITFDTNATAAATGTLTKQ